MAVDRQTTREALATEAATYVTSAQVIFDYKPDDLAGKFPALAFESVGTERTRVQFKQRQTTFFFTAHIFVLYANKKQNWTKAQADDALDAMEHEFATFVESVPKSTGNWNVIDYNGQSVILDNVDMGGERYINEQIPLAIQVYG